MCATEAGVLTVTSAYQEFRTYTVEMHEGNDP